MLIIYEKAILKLGVADNQDSDLLQFAINWMIYGDNRNQHIDGFLDVLRDTSAIMTTMELYKVETIGHVHLYHAFSVQSGNASSSEQEKEY